MCRLYLKYNITYTTKNIILYTTYNYKNKNKQIEPSQAKQALAQPGL